MSTPALTIDPDSSLSAAWSLMVRHGTRHLVVSVNGRCVGLLDDRQLLMQWAASETTLRQLRIGRMISSRTTCVFPETRLRYVAQIMVDDGVDAVPVIDTGGRLVGIITGGDIAAAVARWGIKPDL